MKEGFTFNKVSLMILRKVFFQKFWWWGENRKEPSYQELQEFLHWENREQNY